MKKSTPPNLDTLFEALAHKHRREIVYALSLQPNSISRLASLQKLSLPAIHKHIKILEDANMLSRKKIGRTPFLALKRESLRGLQEWLMQYHPYWGNDKETLENYTSYLQKKDQTTLKLRRGKKGGRSSAKRNEGPLKSQRKGVRK